MNKNKLFALACLGFVYFLLVLSIFGILLVEAYWKRGCYLVVFVLMRDILYKQRERRKSK